MLRLWSPPPPPPLSADTSAAYSSPRQTLTWRHVEMCHQNVSAAGQEEGAQTPPENQRRREAGKGKGLLLSVGLIVFGQKRS